jgi:D-arabinose 1-dehydrogenase-like Zn-dependent alcohol dehydrogenase
MIEQMLRIEGIAVGSRQQFEAMNAAIEVCGITPVIDRVLSLERTTEAFSLMEAGGHFGKIVIEL